jgi:hypothetical protein
MPSLHTERMLRHGDRLLRKLDPGVWNPQSFEVFPEAFSDASNRPSCFVERRKSAREVLIIFEGFPGLREHHFGDRRRRTPEELWDRGFGIGVITFDAIKSLGLDFVVYADGNNVDKKGHAEIANESTMDLELSRLTVAMRYEEVFPPRA